VYINAVDCTIASVLGVIVKEAKKNNIKNNHLLSQLKKIIILEIIKG
jgi:hypothetical protein